jgi:propionyl-CoA carboxylase beta chain
MDINGKAFRAFRDREEALRRQYDETRTARQHSKGKLTAWERIDLLFDGGSFEEIDAYVTPSATEVEFGKVEKAYGDGVIAGHGKINGRLVFAYAQDFTVMGGSLGIVHARKIAKIQEMALKMGAPVIGIMDSGGARIQEGIASLRGYDHLSQHYKLVGHYSTDIGHYGSGCGGRRILPCPHRLRIYDQSNQLHVRYGTQCSEGGS